MDVIARSGDTLHYYSQLFDLPLILVQDANRGIGDGPLLPGQLVKIPGFKVGTRTMNRETSLNVVAEELKLPVDALFLVNQEESLPLRGGGGTLVVPQRVQQRVVTVGVPYSYDILCHDLRKLWKTYPFLTLESAGTSVLKNELFHVKSGRGEKKVHINGSFHANEWITTAILMVFLNDYLLALTNHRAIRGVNMLALYESCLLSAVPMVDPDGVNLVVDGPPSEEPYRTLVTKLNKGNPTFKDWKANIRGVDLNNQLPARWEIEKARKPQAAAPRDYPGDYPLSEPEARAMARLAEEEDFDRVIALHTQGKEFYWGFEQEEPEEAEAIAQEFARVSGYKAVRYVDSYAGYKDWFIQTFRRPGFTIELGEGVNPLPLSQFQDIYDDTLGIFLASLYM
ncbi:gamma-D-glutamyl-L-diamino acid endopeptidase [Fictibacillus macauensis ZFHKF-1]|uniref:Gamma-D-glutamyl-L-diamino acid endopeptidase n=1 Tax=Fictibacillus macauensis ZFHKF-1 TaxID=1196324 RepID=I8UC56_9BACL|nr:M14 family metallocarboxypeptidase [Fictibacillus macauensis]EIT84480.1 gamma-D-glutamyl-L-diamino acid endopeptidase [Fictibacillus macauensis ZFHKF-1]